MLLQNFYKINTLDKITDASYSVSINLNAKHEIFKGHFPGNPVTPGVGMMQIIKELTEQIVGEELFLIKAVNVKFMALINPEETPELKLILDLVQTKDEVKVKNTTFFGDTTALKLTNTYKVL